MYRLPLPCQPAAVHNQQRYSHKAVPAPTKVQRKAEYPDWQHSHALSAWKTPYHKFVRPKLPSQHAQKKYYVAVRFLPIAGLS